MNCLRTILPPPAASDEEQRENDELLSKPAAKKICQVIEWPRLTRLKLVSLTLERYRQNCSNNHNNSGHPVTAQEVFEQGEYGRYEKRYSEKM